MKTEDDRKNFTTRKGFIFNLPDDYDLDESDGDLFGIIEIPFDVFNDKESLGGTRTGQGRGQGRGQDALQRLHVAHDGRRRAQLPPVRRPRAHDDRAKRRQAPRHVHERR